MNRIESVFEKLKKDRKKALIAYVTAGFPSVGITYKLVNVLTRAGVNIIELGVPFSDPIADGPVIQRASEVALKKGINLKKILNLVKKIRETKDTPIILMGYYNPFFAFGIKKFLKEAENSGVDGLIIPDLPPEEAGEFLNHRELDHISTIFLLAPTSTAERIKLITRTASGFIYYVSLTGVTGVRDRLPEDISVQVRKIKKFTDLPVCVGFGISKPEQAKEIAQFADGIIIGSAIMKILLEEKDSQEAFRRVKEFISGVREAIDR